MRGLGGLQGAKDKGHTASQSEVETPRGPSEVLAMTVMLATCRQSESSPAQAAQSQTSAADIERQDPGPSKPFGLGSRPDASPSLMQRIVSPLKTMAMRTAVFASFIAAKQPSRIRSVLKQVRHDVPLPKMVGQVSKFAEQVSKQELR